MLARVIAFFTGAEVAVQAVKAEADFSGELDKTTASAKKLRRELLGIDELNIIGDNGDNVGVGNVGNGLRFREVNVDPIKLPEVLSSPVWSPNPVPAPTFEPVTVPDNVPETIPSPSWSRSYIESPQFAEVMVPAEAGSTVPAPKWSMTEIPSPAFQPVTMPEWAQSPLPIPEWVENPVTAPQMDLRPIETGLAVMQEKFSTAWSTIKEAIGGGASAVAEKMTQIQTNVQTWAETTKANFLTVSDYIQTTIAPALTSAAGSFNTFLENTGSNIVSWGQGVGANIQEVAVYIHDALASGLSSAGTGLASWLNSTASGFVSWGNNVIATAGKAAEGLYSNLTSGLSAAWSSFTSFMKSTGEKISSWWSDNKSWAAPTLTIAVGAAAITAAVMTGGLSIPAMKSLAIPALSLAPALANGGVIRKPTTALVGEYPGARSNPEIVTPESLLRQTFEESSGTDTIVNAVYAVGAMVVKAIEEKMTDITLDGQSLARGTYPYNEQMNTVMGGSMVKF